MVKYDRLLLSTGPWTNMMLGSDVMNPALQQFPLVISNEQTQDFADRCTRYSNMYSMIYDLVNKSTRTCPWCHILMVDTFNQVTLKTD